MQGYNDLFQHHFGLGLYSAHKKGLIVLPDKMLELFETGGGGAFQSLAPRTKGIGVYKSESYYGPYDSDWWENHVKWNPFHQLNGTILHPDGKEIDWIIEHPYDPDASPKPTFDRALAWAREALLVEYGEPVNWISNGLESARDRAVNRHPYPDSELHVGEGLQHMPALTQIGLNAAAGFHVSPAVLRNNDATETRKMWLHSEISEFVSVNADHTNIVESARNVVRIRAEKLRATVNDPNGGLDEAATAEAKLEAREDAMDALEILMAPANLDKAIQAEIDRYDKAELPADLATLKAVLIERTEAAAMARTKYLMRAATQQGIDRGASCVDEDRAVQAVAREAALGSASIRRARDDIYRRKNGVWRIVSAPDDLPGDQADIQHQGANLPADALGVDGDWYLHQIGRLRAQTRYQSALDKIAAVVALNTPTWRIGATDYPANPSADVELTARHVDVIARQIPGVDGDVSATVTADKAVSLTHYTPGDASLATSEVFRITAAAGIAAGEVVTVTLNAENLCGPSRAVVKLTIPA